MFEEVSMFKFKKLTAIALVAVAAMGLLAGCGNDKPKMTQQEGVLRVGSETTFPPFEFTEGDKYVGFDVDLSEAIAKKLGLKMEFKSMGFDALIPAVQSGDIDMIAAGINATPEREKALDFSDVYLKQGADKDLKLVGEPTKAEGTVLGMKKGNKALQEAVNKALKELKEDGTYQKIYDKWFGDYNKK